MMTRFGAFIAVLIFLVTATLAAAQSLGDVARQNRLKKAPAAHRVVTDEDAPAASKPDGAAAKKADSKADSSKSA